VAVSEGLRVPTTMGLTRGVRLAWSWWRPAVLAWALWTLAVLGLAAAPWFDHLLRRAGRPDLVGFDASAIPYLLALVSAATVGAVLASRRPRHPVGWLLLGLGLSVISPLAMPALAGPLEVASGVGAAITGLALLVAAASLVVRFRRARGVERQQLRWVALAAALSLLAVVVVLAGTVLDTALYVWATGVYVALLPVAIGAAILRYRLYDLDRIISRALAYGVLTLILGLGYVGVVLGLGQLLGRSSSLAVAAATLAVAAAFQPARRRVQRAVDRRFNRRRYNAARTIAAFSARLRQEIDLDALTAELLGVVDQTMQPTQVSLWLRPPHAAASAAGAAAPIQGHRRS
jgi:hypothetical protein